MTNSPLGLISYESQDRQVSWLGVKMAARDDFDAFMTNDVASRLKDEEGKKEFEAHLRGLATTGFARESLRAILEAEVSEERDWAIGEAVAEAYLEREYGVIWPWNMERDKRALNASLPGADLIGFKANGNIVRLVLGEVKTSSDKRTPPQVMYGRSGMTHQIDNLANNLGVICQLLKWLLPRCKNTKYESSFNKAIALFLESGNKAIALFGVLIRDTAPDELDLKGRGQALADKINTPTTCQLIAIYLPFNIAELPERVLGGGS